MGAPGREVDDGGDRHRDPYEDHDGDDVLGVGDGEQVQGRREVVVQEERADGGRGQRRQETADEGGGHRHGQEEEHVVREAEIGGDVGEREGQHGGPADADEPAPDDAGAAETRAACDGEAAPLGNFLVRDDVHVEVGARLAGHGHADAGPEDVLPRLAARGAQHDLGRVDAACELQERGRYVVPYHVVEGAAQVLDEGALERELLGEAAVRPSLRAM